MGWRDEALDRLARGERVDRVTALLGIERRTLVGLGHANGFRFDGNGYAHRVRQAGDTTDARDLIRPHLDHPGPDHATVRRWARSQGIPVPSRGTLSRDLVNAYLQSQEVAH